jgi:predicted acylesterase/phospholipase RssA
MSVPANKTAVVLSGGGAYGAFAVGVMKVLFAGRSPATRYEVCNADIYTGTSVGAFNASVMVMKPEESSYETAMRLEDIWLNEVAEHPGRCGNGVFRLRGNPLQYLSVDCLASPLNPVMELGRDTLALGRYILARTANFVASSDSVVESSIALINVGDTIDSSPYNDMLNRVLDREGITRSTKQLRVIATNWFTGETTIFNNLHFTDKLGLLAVMASTAIPGIFPPVHIDNDIYVDGGVVMNTPLSPAINSGADLIHVIYLDPDPQDIRLRWEANSIDTLLRVYNMLLASKIEQDVQSCSAINSALALSEEDRPDLRLGVQALKNSLRGAKAVVDAASSQPMRTLEIHRYFPRRELGGPFGMLNFKLDPILEMIQTGETEALIHDCRRNECLVPGMPPPNREVY